jgi:hypothetical protein
MPRRLVLLGILVLTAAGCGGTGTTHGVLGEQATMSQSRADAQLDRIDWVLRRAEAKPGRSAGPARGQVLALTRSTLAREADRLERTSVPPRLAPRKADLVLALRALASGGSLETVRHALDELR